MQYYITGITIQSAFPEPYAIDLNSNYISICKARYEANDSEWILAYYSLNDSEMDWLAESSASYDYFCQLTLSASSIMHHWAFISGPKSLMTYSLIGH